MQTKSNFNNYGSKNATYDSFNGTELKAWFKINTGYDEFGQPESFELVELGTISAFSDTITFDANPIVAIGFTHPVGIATGDKLVMGTMKFEILKEGFVGEINSILKRANIKHLSISGGSDGTYAVEQNDIDEISEFPLFDLILIGVKENDSEKKIQKEIKGIRFSSGSSAIGLNQIGVSELYKFMAQGRTDWAPVIGATEADITTTKPEDEAYYF